MLPILLVLLTFKYACSISSGDLTNDITGTQELRNEVRKMVGNKVEESMLWDLFRKYGKRDSNWLTSSEVAAFRSTVLVPLKNLRIALIVVDYQNDFINGSLAVGTGDAQQEPTEALPHINRLIQRDGVDRVVYTQDWHPANHISFVEHAHDVDRKLSSRERRRTLAAFDEVQFDSPNITQRLYPSHCVPNTWGVKLPSDLVIAENPVYIHKGTEVLVDSYSAFKNNNGKILELDSMLKNDRINAFMACGLAYDICVRYTLIDGADLGYLAAVSPDCAKGFSRSGIAAAEKEFKEKNIGMVSGAEAVAIMDRNFVPIEWIYTLAMK